MSTSYSAGLTRLQDYWHHVEDVAAGFALGLTMAYLFYRQLYPGVMARRAGTLSSATLALSARSASGVFSPMLLGGEEEEEYEQRGDNRV